MSDTIDVPLVGEQISPVATNYTMQIGMTMAGNEYISQIEAKVISLLESDPDVAIVVSSVVISNAP